MRSKPYSRRAADVEEAFDLAERRGLILSEAFMWRHSPQTSRLLELVPEIGELQTIRATFGFRLTREHDVRLRADLDGGSLMDVGCYCVSAARLLGGEPERVQGEQVVGPTGVDVRFAGILRFANDVLAQFTSSFTHEHSGLEAIGREGKIFVPDPWHARPPRILVNGREETPAREDPYKLQMANVSAAINGDAPVLLGRDDALGQAKALEALYASADI